MWDPWVDATDVMKVKDKYEWDIFHNYFLLELNTKHLILFIICLGCSH